MEIPDTSVFRDDLVALRRGLHRIPELAFVEEETAHFILEELSRLGIPATYGGRGTGVVGRIQGRDPAAPAIALRAEMDALPGDESTGLPFASKRPGRVHACGHDAHMAMVLGAARLLSRGDPPAGDVVLIFQPAEEHGGGARVMMRSGALAGVSAIFGGHVTHHYHTGQIMVTEGVVTAQSDRFVLRVHGKGGHGARPHEAVDAVIVAAFLISVLQTLVSRESDPLHPTVITVGRVQAGTAANVIAEEAVLEGSIRTTVEAARLRVMRGIRRMADAVGSLHGAVVGVELVEGYPPVVNTAREASICRRAAARIFSANDVLPQEHPSMGSEDFAYYLHETPGCFVRFGARRDGWDYVPLHSPAFTVDEDVLPLGAAFFAEVAREAQRCLARRP
ncbi:M20 metallopeptidase family protein [Polyangium mundeleinium]|uniref:M20 family metallopeptidase n=1 Tax=Polyangium mundeleinium TaxID=2995306 RepID=A0ABT5EVB4_9BACT|nr:M20 family metallopeptidase [Polyangium mundeleinium]MDC0744730.1 M20 family metallopeptidase [Polyangium mundeleinium]